MNFNILGKLNKKVLLILVIVGILVVSLLVSTFAFDFFKKKEKQNSATTVQKSLKEKMQFSAEAERALRDADYAYEQAQSKIKAYEEKYGDLILNNFPKGSDGEFCTGMLKDFKEDNGIEVIKPTVQTDDFEGEKLKPYFKNCPGYKTLRSFDIRQSGHYKSHLGYRVYDIDFDNDNKEPKINVFYQSGLYIEYSPKYKYYDSYKVIDFMNKCKVYGEKSVYSIVDYEVSKADPVQNRWSDALLYQTIDISSVKPTKSVNGVIKYKDEYYIYEIIQHSKVPYMEFLYFIKWEPFVARNIKTNVKSKCNFHKNLDIKEEK